MNNNIKKFKVHRYVSYKCATSSEGYLEFLILPRLIKIFKNKLEL
jgi:hypothetical protein